MQLALELALWVALMLPIALSPSFVKVWRSAPRAAKACVMVIGLGILAVQTMASVNPIAPKNAAYPLTPWTMYTTPTRAVSYWALELEDPNGTRTPYPMEWLDRRHVRTLMTRLRLEAQADGGESAQSSALNASLVHLLRMYNQRNPQTPAASIVLTSRRQRLRDYTTPDRIPVTEVARVTLEQTDANR